MVSGVIEVVVWEQYPWLRAGFSRRQGGSSMAYGEAELNLGWTPEDPAEVVAENRRRFVAAVAGQDFGAAELVTMRQVHGNVIHRVRRGAALATSEGKAVLEGDGLLTDERGLMLGVQTADCVPVLLADTLTHAVGGFHAGWRGTVARIVEHGVAQMQTEFGSRPEDLVAAIGPAIRQCCFQVGDEVRERFAEEFVYADDLFVEVDGRLHADLHLANHRQLVGAGVPAESIVTVAECTACARLPDERRRFFSHRAEKGLTGRMMSVVGTND